jgi:hypothetical protein
VALTACPPPNTATSGARVLIAHQFLRHPLIVKISLIENFAFSQIVVSLPKGVGRVRAFRTSSLEHRARLCASTSSPCPQAVCAFAMAVTNRDGHSSETTDTTDLCALLYGKALGDRGAGDVRKKIFVHVV